MSFNSFETSISDGMPFELYEFTYGLTVYRFCTIPERVTIGTAIYDPLPISRGGIQLTEQNNKAQVSIYAPADFIVANLFKTSVPSQAIFITIKKKHYNEPEVIVEWTGRVMTAKWADAGVEMVCESTYSALSQNVNKRHYSFSCPHVLYGEECRANPSLHKLVTTVTVSGLTLTSENFGMKPNGFYTGGTVTYQDDNYLLHTRFIFSHTGNNIVLTQQLPYLPANAQVTVYPGCDHTLETCKDKFDNVVNFGGFPWIPGKNPFTTASSIYF